MENSSKRHSFLLKILRSIPSPEGQSQRLFDLAGVCRYASVAEVLIKEHVLFEHISDTASKCGDMPEDMETH